MSGRRKRVKIEPVQVKEEPEEEDDDHSMSTSKGTTWLMKEEPVQVKEEPPEAEDIGQRSTPRKCRTGRGRTWLTSEESRKKNIAATIQRRKEREAKETPEQREKRLERERNRKKNRLAKETPEHKVARLEKQRTQYQRLKTETPNKYKELLESQRFLKMAKRTKMTDEQREEKERDRFFMRQSDMYRVPSAWRNLSEEEKFKKIRQAAEWRQNLTGEKRQKYLEGVYRAQRKMYQARRLDPERMKQFREKLNAYHRNRYANETPDQRHKRRIKDNINGTKMRLKRKLKAEGVRPEEIQRQLQELADNMWMQYYPGENIPRHLGRRRSKHSSPAGKFETESDSSYPSTSQTDSQVHLDNIPSSSSASCQLRCDHCPCFFSSDSQLQNHLDTFHIDKVAQLFQTVHGDEDPIIFIEASEANHDVSSQKFNFTCMRCTSAKLMRFTTRLELFSHVKSLHASNFWPCEDCKLLTYSKRALGRHRRLCSRHR